MKDSVGKSDSPGDVTVNPKEDVIGIAGSDSENPEQM